MYIQKIKIQNLRILQEVELTPSAGLNAIVGPNGAGKSTLLEAIFLLGQGKSFRHSSAGPMIREGCAAAQVAARLVTGSGRTLQLGMQRGRDHLIARNGGNQVKRRSDLMRLLPIQLLTPNSHELVEKGPDLRRRFLDQGLFHVEQSYHPLVKRYLRALRQRNAALRNRQKKLAFSFHSQLADAGEKIQQMRQAYLDDLKERVGHILQQLGAEFGVEVRLRRGWPEGELEELYSRRIDVELERGYTLWGPHRAEIHIQVSGVAVTKRLSRGQQKLLVYALGFAQMERVRESLQESPILLIDDMGAEFDERRLGKVLEWLAARDVQGFVTLLDSRSADGVAEGVFHVEHGIVEPRKGEG